MIIWHGFNYGYDADSKEWYVINTKTGERHTFSSYNEANWFVENHRAHERRNTMTYKISFNALTTDGDVVGTATLTITTDKPLMIQKKSACFRRMCVEYARLIGISCSFAEILTVEGGDGNE